MAKSKKIFFRTSPFHAPERVREDFVFWVMEPSADKPGFQIKEFYMGLAAEVPSGGIDRIADALTHRDALIKMDALEKSAAAKYKRVDDDDEDNAQKLGIEYSQAEHFLPHYQSVVAGMNHDLLKQSRRPPPKLKPGP